MDWDFNAFVLIQMQHRRTRIKLVGGTPVLFEPLAFRLSLFFFRLSLFSGSLGFLSSFRDLLLSVLLGLRGIALNVGKIIEHDRHRN